MKNLTFFCHLSLGLAVIGISGVGLSAQNCDDFEPVEHPTIQMDDRGVQSFKYTNPRRPFPLAKPDPHQVKIEKECKTLWKINAARSGATIDSDDASRVFVVTIAFELLEKRLDLSEALSRIEILNLADSLKVTKSDLTLSEIEERELPDDFEASANEIFELLKGLESDDLRYSLENLQGKTTRKLDSLESSAQAYLEDRDQPPLAVKKLVAYLESGEEGFFDSLNEVATLLTKDISRSDSLFEAAQSLAMASIELDLIRQSSAGTGKVASGGPISCKPTYTNGKKSCSWTWRLNFGAPKPIDPRVLFLNAPRLEMEVLFLDTVESPDNAMAYLLTAVGSEEKVSKTQLTINGSVGFKKDPDTTPGFDSEIEEEPDFLSPTHPYDGRELERFFGSGEIVLGRNLGDRADATLNVTFKKADFGAGEDLDPEVSKYQVRAYGQTGLGLRFGRFSFAKPSSGLAINQFGEGFQFFYQDFKLGYLLRKESLDGKADFEDDDSEAYIAEWNGLGEVPGLRSGTLYGLYGKERQIAQDYDYWTLGAEVNFSLFRDRTDHQNPDYAAVGQLALFRSERNLGRQCVPDPEMPDENCDPKALLGDGSGTSALLSLSLSRLVPRPGSNTKLLAPEVYTLTVGYASGDDPTTPKDEGYLGENAKFGGLGSVVGSFLGKMDPEDPGQIGVGLANKNFIGLDLTTARRRFSPLWWITNYGLKLGGDVKSSKTTFSLREIRFTEEVLGSKDAGREVSIQWQIEVPKGVVTTLSYGKFFPGDSLEPILKSDPSILQANMQVKIK